jgi:uncharacterized membrane protein
MNTPTKTKITAMALAAALGSALAGSASAHLEEGAAGKEKCFGVSLAGKKRLRLRPGHQLRRQFHHRLPG